MKTYIPFITHKTALSACDTMNCTLISAMNTNLKTNVKQIVDWVHFDMTLK